MPKAILTASLNSQQQDNYIISPQFNLIVLRLSATGSVELGLGGPFLQPACGQFCALKCPQDEKACDVPLNILELYVPAYCSVSATLLSEAVLYTKNLPIWRFNRVSRVRQGALSKHTMGPTARETSHMSIQLLN